eukprot:gene748-biopygen13318
MPTRLNASRAGEMTTRQYPGSGGLTPYLIPANATGNTTKLQRWRHRSPSSEARGRGWGAAASHPPGLAALGDGPREEGRDDGGLHPLPRVGDEGEVHQKHRVAPHPPVDVRRGGPPPSPGGRAPAARVQSGTCPPENCRKIAVTCMSEGDWRKGRAARRQRVTRAAEAPRRLQEGSKEAPRRLGGARGRCRRPTIRSVSVRRRERGNGAVRLSGSHFPVRLGCDDPGGSLDPPSNPQASSPPSDPGMFARPAFPPPAPSPGTASADLRRAFRKRPFSDSHVAAETPAGSVGGFHGESHSGNDLQPAKIRRSSRNPLGMVPDPHDSASSGPRSFSDALDSRNFPPVCYPVKTP